MFHRHAFLPAILLGVLSAFAHCAEIESKVEIPVSIQAPAGAKLLHKGKAKGKQIYVGVMVGANLVWKHEAPRAEVTVGEAIWKHYDGPTWEAQDGSKVKKVDGKDSVKMEAAPDAKADIPWLLIRVAPTGDKGGALSVIRLIQRINTKGGQPPAQPPAKAGERVEIDYTSDYYFYTGE